MTADFLDVPGDLIEPLGKLAIVAGRIELAAGLAYRAFLTPLNAYSKLTILNGLSYRQCVKIVTDLTRTEPAQKSDPNLSATWSDWATRSGAFMRSRNTWVHATWARGPGSTRVPVSATRPAHSIKPVTAADIDAAVSEGTMLVTEGQALLTRIRTVVASDAYNETPPNRFPEGVQPI